MRDGQGGVRSMMRGAARVLPGENVAQWTNVGRLVGSIDLLGKTAQSCGSSNVGLVMTEPN